MKSIYFYGLIYLLFFSSLPFKAIANPPPKFVYRYDTRPPGEIFNNGFTAMGVELGNNDPLLHIVGGDVLDDTRFISTSESPGALVNVFTEMQIESNTREIYLYRIRAAPNFYSMLDYLNNLIQIGHITGDSRVTLAASLLERYRYQREWFAVDRIDANQIAGVQRLLNHGEEHVSIGPEELNRNYVDRDTHASAIPYPLVGGPVPPRVAFMRTRVGPAPTGTLMGPPSPPIRGFLSSLFSCLPSGSGSSSSGRTSSYNELKCEADISMSLGYYYGVVDNLHDIL